MEELSINFSAKEDPTLVILKDEDKVKLLKTVNDLSFIVVNMKEGLTKNTLEVGFSETLCSLAEHYIADIHKALNYESKLLRDKEERHKAIREANEQNRELRRQLGEKVTNDQVRERMKLFCEYLNKWWDDFGCGYISKIELGEYGIKMKVSFMISGIGDKGKKEIADSLKAQSVLVSEKHDYVVDCDSNRKWFEDLVKTHFPSGTVFEMSSYGGERRTLRDAEVVIRNLDDIKEPDLPAAPVIKASKKRRNEK